MKIDRSLNVQQVNPYQRQQNEHMQQKKKSGKQDQIHISEQAQNMLQQTEEKDPAHMKKVEHIKAQVQNGTYKVNHERVAAAFYDFWLNGRESNDKG